MDESLAESPTLETIKNPYLELNGFNTKQVVTQVKTGAKLKEVSEHHCFYCLSKTCDKKPKISSDFLTYFQSPSFVYRTCEDFVDRQGVWIQRDYHRLNVYTYIDQFCGWWAIEELLKYCGKHEPFFLTMFKTGGRVKEVLSLQKDFFKIDNKADCAVVSSMLLEKHYRKDKDTGETVTVHATRKPFPIPLSEKLSSELMAFLEQSKGGLLFPSPYKKNDIPLSRQRVYQVIREVSDSLPPKLFKELGLDRPLLDENGKPITDKIHLWNHYFRSQRACQLRLEYGFQEGNLMEWFSWLDVKTAVHYSRIGYSGLASKMKSQEAPN